MSGSQLPARRLAAAGNGIVYTDAAWHIDAPELLHTTGDFFSGGIPADQANLGNIVDSLNAFSAVPLEGRHEILGINQPGHSDGAHALARRTAAAGQDLPAGQGTEDRSGNQ